jgi:hypothetical protein
LLRSHALLNTQQVPVACKLERSDDDAREHASIETKVFMLTGGATLIFCSGRKTQDVREDARHSVDGKHLALNQVLRLRRGR